MNTATKYFDAVKMIESYENDRNEILAEESKRLIIRFETVINKAYQAGYHDGMEVAHG